MKKILLGLISIGIITPVFAAANWYELDNNGKIFYIDKSSVLQKNSSMYMFWIKQKKNSSTYIKSLMAVDCSNNTGGLQKVITYTNEKATNVADTRQSLDYIIPDSDSSVAYDYICGLHTAKLNKQKKLVEEQEKLRERQERNQAAKDLLNTGLGVGMYFLGR